MRGRNNMTKENRAKIIEGFDKVHPQDKDKEATESIQLQLAKMKLEKGEQLTAKDRLALGWSEIHKEEL